MVSLVSKLIRSGIFSAESNSSGKIPSGFLFPYVLAREENMMYQDDLFSSVFLQSSELFLCFSIHTLE